MYFYTRSPYCPTESSSSFFLCSSPTATSCLLQLCDATVLKAHAVFSSSCASSLLKLSWKLQKRQQPKCSLPHSKSQTCCSFRLSCLFSASAPYDIHTAYPPPSSPPLLLLLLVLLLLSVLGQHAGSSSLQAMSWTLQRRPRPASGWPASTLLSC